MKRLVITTLLALMIPNTAYAFIDMYENPAVERTPEQQELEDIQEFFFERPLRTRRVVNSNEKIQTSDNKELGGMPLFKQLRIKVTNHYKIKAHEEMLREKKLEAEEMQKLMQEDEIKLEDLQKQNLQNLLDSLEPEKKNETETSVNSEEIPKKKFGFFKRNKKSDTEQEALTPETEANQASADEKQVNETSAKEKTKTLQSGVRQIEAEKEAVLDCQVVNYLEDTSEVEALGRPVLKFPTQGITIIADRLTYNTETNVIKAFDNVEVTRYDNTMYGDYLQINMNEENALITNLKSEKMNMTIYADVANASDDYLVLEKGKLLSEKSYVLKFQTQFLKARIDKMVIPEAAQSHLDDLVGHTKVKIVAKNIKVDAKEEHDTISLRDAKVQIGDTKIFNFKRFTVHTNKHHNFVETNIPEFGSRSRIGMFAGPGFVFDTPFASTVKVMPLINYKDDLGFGGALRYSSATNRTDMMYGSAKHVFVMRGKQFLDDNLYLHYGVNSYMNDWWMGQRMAKYHTELVYTDGTRINNFLGKGMPLTFKQRIGLGYMHDSDVNRFDEKIKSHMIGTTRFKYMTGITQTLYSYHNTDKRLHLDAGITMQGSAAIYGTGDTQFIGRVGPILHTQYKYWMQDIGYFQSAYEDHSPIPRFDTYRYGKQNVYFREALRVNKYLIVAYAASINLSGDAANKKDLQESAFIVSLGPDDFKVSIGYDFMREQTYFTLSLALDTKGSSVEYDKLEISHPEKLGKDTKKYVKPIVFPEEVASKKPIRRTYARVIEIEDPNKEQI